MLNIGVSRRSIKSKPRSVFKEILVPYTAFSSSNFVPFTGRGLYTKNVQLSFKSI